MHEIAVNRVAAEHLGRRYELAGRFVFALTALVVFLALAIQLSVTASHSGGHFTSSFDRAANVFVFFTVQSNIIVGVTSLLLAIRLERPSGAFAAFRLAGLVAITITLVVYHAFLAGLVDLTAWGTVSDQMLHSAAPALAIGGWLLFGPRGRASWRVAALAFVFPVAWVVFTLMRGALIGWYPYPFIDVGQIGYARAALNIAGITLVFWGLCAGAIVLDRRLVRRSG